jgi:hypothetical protein
MTKSLIILGMSSRKSRAFCASAYDIFSPERFWLKTGGFSAEGWTWRGEGRWEEGRWEVGRGEMLTWNLCLSQEGRKKSPPRFSSDHGAPSTSYHSCQKRNLKKIPLAKNSKIHKYNVRDYMTLKIILIRALQYLQTSMKYASHTANEGPVRIQ